MDIMATMNDKQSILNLEKARASYASDGAFMKICDHLATHTKSRSETEALSLASSVSVTYAEAVAVFRRFEELEFGRFLVGRHGHPTRFRWSRRSADVAKAIKGEVDELPKTAEDPSEDAESASESGSTNGSTVVARYQLRPDFEITTVLPRDMTKDEAARFADYARTVYFRP